MLPSFLGHVPVEEEREPKQSTSNTISKAHGPRAAPLAFPGGTSEYAGNTSSFRCSLFVPRSRKRKAHTAGPVILSQTSANSKGLYWELSLTEAQTPQLSSHYKTHHGCTTDLYKSRNPPTQSSCGRLVFCGKSANY